MKLLIAIPAMDSMPVDTVRCLLDLTRKLQSQGVDYETRIEAGTLVHLARDRLAKYAIIHKFTHVLWLDSDMIFTDELLDDLQFCGKPFVTGIAHGRRKPFLSCLFKSYYPEVVRWTYNEYPSRAFEVAACGFAAVLIETQILNDVLQRYNTCFLPTQFLSEDVAFCDRARTLGYHVYAEPGVKLGHIGRMIVYPEDSLHGNSDISNYEEVIDK